MIKFLLAGVFCLLAAGPAGALEPLKAVEINFWTGRKNILEQYDTRFLSLATTLVQPGQAERMNVPDRRKTLSPSRFSSLEVLAVGLKSPDGLAVHPQSGVVYVSQDDIRISAIHDGVSVTSVDAGTPVYVCAGAGMQVRGDPLLLPEPIAFSPEGDLYVAEDRPDGRLIQFTLDDSGRGIAGQTIWIPGDWSAFSWEGVAVGPNDEILLSGSSAESAISGDAPGLFEGVLLYRDCGRGWWQLDRRALRSFSQVAFSQDGTKAVYACEVTGEINWLDLSGKKMQWGSSSTYAANTAEGICVLGDGRVLVAEAGGTLIMVDPSTDRATVFAEVPGYLETLVWDPRERRILATEDRTGRILSWTESERPSQDEYSLDHALFEPARTPRYVPSICPDFVARLLAIGGLDFNSGELPVSFATFARRVPLVAVDAEMMPIGPADTASKDPIVRLQAAVFHPDSMTLPGFPQSGPLAIVIATTRSGKVIKTSSKEVSAAVADFAVPFVQAAGAMRVTVPFPGLASVSEKGICNIHLMGMGETPDFHLLLNPLEPEASYVVVDDGPNGIQQYQLSGPRGETLARNMVISFSKELSTKAKWLGRDEKFAKNESVVEVVCVSSPNPVY